MFAAFILLMKGLRLKGGVTFPIAHILSGGTETVKFQSQCLNHYPCQEEPMEWDRLERQVGGVSLMETKDANKQMFLST